MVKVPYFDAMEIPLAADHDPAKAGVAAALEAFLSLTPADRLRDTRHVFAYYLDVRDVVGEEWLDEEMGVPDAPEDIWSFIHPRVVGFWPGRRPDDNCYVFVEAHCGWDDEHGLLMVWRNGAVLNKVGDFDGHATNAGANADQSLNDVVYRASNPEFTTRL